MDYSIKIIKVDNGFILESYDDDEENSGKPILNQTVIEDSGGEDSEIETMINLLQNIKEYFGVHYSKHNKKNLDISIKETND